MATRFSKPQYKRDSVGPLCDKKWPKGCAYSPKHVGECANRFCNFPNCTPIKKPKQASGYKKH